MDNREREERERRAAEIEAKAGHTAECRRPSKEGQRKIWRRKRTKRCPAERKPVQGRQQGPCHLKLIHFRNYNIIHTYQTVCNFRVYLTMIKQSLISILFNDMNRL